MKNYNYTKKAMWISLVLILTLGLLSTGETYDFQYHNTYFVMKITEVGFILTLMVIGLGLLYDSVGSGRLHKWLTIVHVLFSGIGLVMIVTGIVIFPEKLHTDRAMLSWKLGSYGVYSFFFSQLFLIINVLVTIIKRNGKSF